MYAIYGNIYHQYTPNVGIYTIHGSYGYDHFILETILFFFRRGTYFSAHLKPTDLKHVLNHRGLVRHGFPDGFPIPILNPTNKDFTSRSVTCLLMSCVKIFYPSTDRRLNNKILRMSLISYQCFSLKFDLPQCCLRHLLRSYMSHVTSVSEH